MPSIYESFDKSPAPLSGHIVAGHVQGSKGFTVDKSFFTDATGAALGMEAALTLLCDAKGKVGRLPSAQTKTKAEISMPPVTVKALKIDNARPQNVGFAVTWGEQVGSDSRGTVCEWICMFINSKMQGGRYQWVTAFPAKESYVTNHAA